LAASAPPMALAGVPEEADQSDNSTDSDTDSDKDEGPAFGAAAGAATTATVPPATKGPSAVTIAKAPTIGAAESIMTLVGPDIADDTVDPGTSEDMVDASLVKVETATCATAAEAPPAAKAASPPPFAKAAAAVTAAAAADSIMTRARATAESYMAMDSTAAVETVESGTASVEASTAGVQAAPAEAEVPGAPIHPAGHAGETGETGQGPSGLCLHPDAPPAFAAEFQPMSADPRFVMALNEDCDDDDPNWDFFFEVSDMMLRGVEAGWLGRSS
jgi:hypothetical protein